MRLLVALPLVALALLAIVACSKSPQEVSFNQQVLPILKRNCVICHMTGDTQGNLGLHPEPYLALVSAPSSQSRLVLVEPGSIENSYLYHKLMDTQASVGGEGSLMPYQRDALAQADIDIIRRWIIEGAQPD